MKHLQDIGKLSAREVRGLLKLTQILRTERETDGRNAPLLQGKQLAMLFMKPSLRTRVSFEVGMRHLGGHAFYLSPEEVGMGTRETPADVARVLGGMADGIMARVFAHAHIEELTAHAGIPVINGLSDGSHPCQALADVYTLQQEFGTLQGLKVAFVGDGDNNVCRSLLEAGLLLGMEMRVIAPRAYQPTAAYLAALPGAVQVTDDRDAVRGADVVYTDVWVSMGQEEHRATRLRALADYRVDRALLDLCGNPDLVVLHCLPAHRGEEIADDVMDSPRSRVFPQAHNRLHTQKAVLAHLLGGVPLPD